MAASSTAPGPAVVVGNAASLGSGVQAVCGPGGAAVIADGRAAGADAIRCHGAVAGVRAYGFQYGVVAGGGKYAIRADGDVRVVGTLSVERVILQTARQGYAVEILNRAGGALSATTTAGLYALRVGNFRSGAHGLHVRPGPGGAGIQVDATPVGADGVRINAANVGVSAYGRKAGVVAGGVQLALRADGNATVSGTLSAWLKNFVQPHPEDPGLEVVFTCLEGNEAGTCFRGTGRLRNGQAVIEPPEAWRLVTAPEGITVHLTPIRSLARLAAWEVSRERIVVRGSEDCRFAYFVCGRRRAVPETARIRPNRHFRPQLRGVPFGQQYPPALRQLLVRNGLLNADYTPNEATAQRLGWELRDPTPAEAARAWAAEALWQREHAGR